MLQMAGRGRNNAGNNNSQGPRRGGPPSSGLMHQRPFPRDMLPLHQGLRPRLSPMFSEEELANQQDDMYRRNLPPLLGPHSGLPRPAFIEQKLASQHAEIQRLLNDNEQLVAIHATLRHDLSAAQQELQHRNSQTETEKDGRIKALLERVSQMEVDLRAMDSLKEDMEKLLLQRQELVAKLQQETQRAQVDAHQLATLKAQIDGLQQELQHARITGEQERKASAEHLEYRQATERSYYAMVKEVERLRSELANAETRAHRVSAGGTGSATAGALPLKYYDNGNAVQQKPWRGAYEDQQGMAAQELISSIRGQLSHTDNAITSAGSSNSQQVLQDQLIKLTNDTALVKGWSMHLAPNGKYFYYNPATGVTQWENPAAMVAIEGQHQPQVQMSPLQEEKRQQPEPLLYQYSTLQQQPSMAGVNKGVQPQVHQPSANFEQKPVGQTQALQLGSAQTQNSSILAQNPAHPQSSLLMQFQVNQQALSEPNQSAWSAQKNTGAAHTQYPQTTQQLGQMSYAGLYAQAVNYPGQAVAQVATESSAHALQNVRVAHVPAPPAILPQPEASDPLVRVMPESVSARNPVSTTRSGPQGANLFVFGVPDDFNDSKLAELFRPHGVVLHANISTDRDTGRGKGYGFVSMDSPQAAEAAIGAVNGRLVSGKRIVVELKRRENDLHHQQQPQGSLSSGVGPTRWQGRNDTTSRHRPY